MGMYTGITFKAKVKKEYEKLFDLLYKVLNDDDSEYEFGFTYIHICKLFEYCFGDMTGLESPYFLFYNDSYMDNEWCNSEYSNGYDNTVITVKTSIKNYKGQHGRFLDFMSQVIDECYICEVIYEECVSPDVYKFIDGEFVIVKHGEYGY